MGFKARKRKQYALQFVGPGTHYVMGFNDCPLLFPNTREAGDYAAAVAVGGRRFVRVVEAPEG